MGRYPGAGSRTGPSLVNSQFVISATARRTSAISVRGGMAVGIDAGAYHADMTRIDRRLHNESLRPPRTHVARGAPFYSPAHLLGIRRVFLTRMTKAESSGIYATMLPIALPRGGGGPPDRPTQEHPACPLSLVARAGTCGAIRILQFWYAGPETHRPPCAQPIHRPSTALAAFFITPDNPLYMKFLQPAVAFR